MKFKKLKELLENITTKNYTPNPRSSYGFELRRLIEEGEIDPQSYSEKELEQLSKEQLKIFIEDYIDNVEENTQDYLNSYVSCEYKGILFGSHSRAGCYVKNLENISKKNLIKGIKEELGQELL